MARQKKQEEKRLRRLAKHLNPDAEGGPPVEGLDPGLESEAGGETPGAETPGEGTPEKD